MRRFLLVMFICFGCGGPVADTDQAAEQTDVQDQETPTPTPTETAMPSPTPTPTASPTPVPTLMLTLKWIQAVSGACPYDYMDPCAATREYPASCFLSIATTYNQCDFTEISDDFYEIDCTNDYIGECLDPPYANLCDDWAYPYWDCD
jgi:hypothetical protein